MLGCGSCGRNRFLFSVLGGQGTVRQGAEGGGMRWGGGGGELKCKARACVSLYDQVVQFA
jgi:hypothetical protein